MRRLDEAEVLVGAWTFETAGIGSGYRSARRPAAAQPRGRGAVPGQLALVRRPRPAGPPTTVGHADPAQRDAVVARSASGLALGVPGLRMREAFPVSNVASSALLLAGANVPRQSRPGWTRTTGDVLQSARRRIPAVPLRIDGVRQAAGHARGDVTLDAPVTYDASTGSDDRADLAEMCMIG
ncbi:hypothetical protein Sviol_01530 [Streptomyces violascens]|uniref:Uncharacterized protein n=1 Tax=Streptomyces violascens TaxID=67381 RepID=A0ABQ3QEP4_9ACTN|nr:hypothetical protein Sviol_01530 [Streptomyces violascens]